MPVRLRYFLLACLACVAEPTWSFSDRFSVEGFVELQASRDRGEQPWLNEGFGKLRYDQSNDGIQLSQGAITTQWGFESPWKLTAVWHARDDLNKQIDPTEAYLRYKPLPFNGARFSLRLGAFYPKISLENTQSAWTNRYLVSSSAINTWIGEEIRTIGGEGSVLWRGRDRQSPHTFALFGAITSANDPAGTLLAWRGWAIHDRQTSLTERLPLANLPAFQSGQVFAEQPQWLEPFSEIDNRLGWYAGASWSYEKQHKITAMFYDNRADPSATDDDGQYAWHTKFYHVAWRYRITRELTWLSQWMSGTSVMGVETNIGLPLDIEYDAYYGLLTYQWGPSRISIRYDDFEVTDEDQTANDNNNEQGHGWALAYLRTLRKNIWAGAEYGIMESDRMSRAYQGNPTAVTERTFKFVVRLKL